MVSPRLKKRNNPARQIFSGLEHTLSTVTVGVPGDVLVGEVKTGLTIGAFITGLFVGAFVRGGIVGIAVGARVETTTNGMTFVILGISREIQTFLHESSVSNFACTRSSFIMRVCCLYTIQLTVTARFNVIPTKNKSRLSNFPANRLDDVAFLPSNATAAVALETVENAIPPVVFILVEELQSSDEYNSMSSTITRPERVCSFGTKKRHEVPLFIAGFALELTLQSFDRLPTGSSPSTRHDMQLLTESDPAADTVPSGQSKQAPVP
jgi:hypothetical protein